MKNKTKKQNKKALTQTMIVGLIISTITLILLLFYINSQIQNYRYSESMIGCNILFSNIDGKPTYFGESLDKISSKLTDEIAKQCPSRKITISDKSINKAAELISECWKKTGNGEDIFGANVKNQKICLYCGEIVAEKTITDFKGKLTKELNKAKYLELNSKETEIKNFNEMNLQLIPQNFEESKSITVFYYVYRTDIPKNADVSTWIRDEYLTTISKLTGEIGSVFTTANFQISGNVLKTYGGIILTKEIENKNKEDFKKFTNTINNQDCTVIIPIKNFD